MDVKTAHLIVAQVASLTELVTRFQALFGSDYRMKPGSPARAWELDEQIRQTQAAIARLLDKQALDNPFIRHGRWWETQDVMNTSLMTELATTAVHLLMYCTCYETRDDKREYPLTMRLAQETIAGMLHPAARQLGYDRETELREIG